MNRNQDTQKIHQPGMHSKRGPTSYHMHDQDFIFKELDIKEGDYFLDLGCGIGEYSVHASGFVGDSGLIYALDIQESAIQNLKSNIKNMGLTNIRTFTADITKSLPLEDDSIDICLIATVLHTLDLGKNDRNMFKEIFRILKPKGRLITIDCKKDERGFGPPLHLRISSEELEGMVIQYGFEKLKLMDLGPFYMYQFIAKR